MESKPHDQSLLDVVALLVLMQGGIAVVSTLEAGVLGAAFGGGALVLTVINLIAALAALFLSWGIRRRSSAARRLTIWIEVSIIVVATLDLLLALIFAQRSLELVPVLVRFVLPFVIIRRLRKPYVRAWFAPKAVHA